MRNTSIYFLIILLFLSSASMTYAQFGGGGGGGGGGSVTVSFTGPTTVAQNSTYTYYVSVSGGTHQSTNYTVSGGTIVSQSISQVRVRWTSSGTRWVEARATVSGSLYTQTKIVTVTPPPLTAGSIGGTKTICYNASAGTLTNTASASGGTGTKYYQWQYKSGSSWYNISGATSTTSSPGNLTATRQYRRRVTAGGVTKYTNTVTVTVRANLTAGSINGSKTICYNASAGTLGNSSSASGGSGTISYQWQYKSGSSWYNITSGTSSSYSPGNLTSTRQYRRRASNSCGTVYSNTVTVTVHPNLLPGSINGNKTICYNASAGTLGSSSSASGGSGGISYQWQWLNGSTWTNISGATSSTYAPGNLTSTRKYRRRASNSCGTVYTGLVTVTVNPNLTAGSINGSKTICYNASAGTLGNSSSASGGSGSISYQWQWLNGSTWTNISGATSTTYAPGNLTSTRQYRRRASNSCGTVYTGTVTVTVNANLNAGSINGSKTICYNASAGTLGNSSSASGGSGSISYQWQWLNGSTWTNISGATSTTYAPGNLTSSRQYRRRASNSCGTVYTGTVTVTVNANLNAGSINGSKTICYNASAGTLGNSSSASGGSGSISYQWQWLNGSTWTNISGATSTTYAPGNLTSTRQYRRRASNSCGTVYSGSVTVTVNPNLTAGSINGDKTICYNASAGTLGNSSSASGGSGTISYQWQWLNSSTWTNISGATSTTFAPGNLTSTRQYRRRASNSCGTVYTNTVTVNVNANLSAGSINGSKTICYNASAGTLGNSSSATGGSGTISYQWQYYTGSSWSSISGATSSTYSPGNLTTTRQYRRQASNSCGTVNTNTVTVTVNPNLTPGSISGTQTLCFNHTAATLGNSSSASGGSGTINYQWQYYNGSSWIDLAGATGTSYSPGALTSSRTYRRRASNSCGTVYTNQITTTVQSPVGQQAISNTIEYTLDEIRLERNGIPAPGTEAYWQTSASGTSETSGGAFFPITASGTYYLRAKNTSTGCWSTAASKVVLLTLDEPTSAIYETTKTSTVVDWTAEPGATGYDVYRSTDGTNYTFLQTTPGSQTSLLDDSLSASTSYYYRVRAEKNGEYSTGSTAVQVTTNPEPLVDTDLGFKAQHNGNIAAIRWNNALGEQESLYAYSYDHADRLTAGQYGQNSGTVATWVNDPANSGAYSVHNIGYDANGNIETLNRQVIAGSVTTEDALTYTYNATGTQLMKVSDDGGTGGFLDGNKQGDDYAYDAIGNLTKDLNKGITDISYNILDLPEEITFEDGTVIRNTYLADGTKVKQELFPAGTTNPASKTTAYDGRLVYENDTLAYAHHAEGRVVFSLNAQSERVADYQYNLTDHQGNTRVTVSATPVNYTTVATMEVSSESENFSNYVATSAGAPEANSVGHVYRNFNTTNSGLGMSTVLKVDKGDTIKASAHAYYLDSRPSFPMAAVGLISGALFSTYGSGGGPEGLSIPQSSFDDVYGTGGSLGGKTSNTNVPQGYINYIFFDEEMSYVTGGYKQLGSASNGNSALVSMDEFIADQKGILLVYLSNETSGAQSVVSWDDFTIYHGKTNIVQAQDYYPFGEAFNAFTRTASRPNEYLFNGGVELNEKTNYYETAFRQYDPQIGRFTAIDPLADQFGSWTPYQYGFNDPIYYNDVLGLAPNGSLAGDMKISGGDAGNRHFGSGLGPNSGAFGGWNGPTSPLHGNYWSNHAHDMVGNYAYNYNILSTSGFDRRYGFDQIHNRWEYADAKAKFLLGFIEPTAEEKADASFALNRMFGGRAFTFDREGGTEIYDATDYALVLALRSILERIRRQKANYTACEGDCPTEERKFNSGNYPLPKFWEILGFDQESWNKLVNDYLTTKEVSEDSSNSGMGFLHWLTYKTPFGDFALGSDYLVVWMKGRYSKSDKKIMDEVNIGVFFEDQNMVNILKDSTENGASDGALLNQMRRTNSIKIPKVTKN